MPIIGALPEHKAKKGKKITMLIREPKAGQ